VKMHECKTKHINIYMSFSNRPNLVSKLEVRRRAHIWIIA
jgi:hypothetical protein